MQGKKLLALSSPSCASLNVFIKIKFYVFEWRERGAASKRKPGVSSRPTPHRAETVVSWERIHRGLGQKLPHRISLSGALSAGEREAWSPALVGAVQVLKDGFVTSFACIHVVCSSGARGTPSQAAFILGSGSHG